MPITRDELASKLAEDWKKYMITEGSDIIEISLTSKNYTGPTGEHFMPIILKIEEEGKYLKIIVPGLYSLKPAIDRQSSAQLHRKLLQISWETKLVQFEFENLEQEIRGIVEIPIEDGTLTAQQIQRAVETLHGVIDYYHTEVLEIIEGRHSPLTIAQTQNAIASYSKIFNSRKDQLLKR